jgi:hypothetical protein
MPAIHYKFDTKIQFYYFCREKQRKANSEKNKEHIIHLPYILLLPFFLLLPEIVYVAVSGEALFTYRLSGMRDAAKHRCPSGGEFPGKPVVLSGNNTYLCPADLYDFTFKNGFQTGSCNY